MNEPESVKTWDWDSPKEYPVGPDSDEEECYSCGIPNHEVPLRAYKPGRAVPSHVPRSEPYPWHWLCDLCAATPAGSALTYPDQYPEARTLETICYVGNRILLAIKDVEQRLPHRETRNMQ